MNRIIKRIANKVKIMDEYHNLPMQGIDINKSPNNGKAIGLPPGAKILPKSGDWSNQEENLQECQTQLTKVKEELTLVKQKQKDIKSKIYVLQPNFTWEKYDQKIYSADINNLVRQFLNLYDDIALKELQIKELTKYIKGLKNYLTSQKNK